LTINPHPFIPASSLVGGECPEKQGIASALGLGVHSSVQAYLAEMGAKVDSTLKPLYNETMLPACTAAIC